jgi:hypothetical protein
MHCFKKNIVILYLFSVICHLTAHLLYGVLRYYYLICKNLLCHYYYLP